MGNALSHSAALSRKRKQKATRKQKGGFYPSVYGGVAGATILAPLVARQTLRMFNSSSRRASRKKNKRNYTRSIA